MGLLSILGLSTWTCTRWTMIGHHISHGGYNRQDDPKAGGTGRFTTYRFAIGSVYRRARDWFDWMLPEAWNVEHNNLHHYRLGESGDPDLVERNLDIMRQVRLPRALKYVAVAFLAAMWKWYYYAPNTYKQLKISQMRKEGKFVSEEEAHEAFVLPVALFSQEGKKFGTGPIDFLRNCMGPYLLLRFFLMPAPLALLSPAFYWAAVTNLALSDVLSNIHSFIIIATNHCGDDMYKFSNSCTPRSGTFYMRAVTSSSNFRTSRCSRTRRRRRRCAPSVRSTTCLTSSRTCFGDSRRRPTSWWVRQTCAHLMRRGSIRQMRLRGQTRSSSRRKCSRTSWQAHRKHEGRGQGSHASQRTIPSLLYCMWFMSDRILNRRIFTENEVYLQRSCSTAAVGNPCGWLGAKTGLTDRQVVQGHPTSRIKRRWLST